MYEIYIKEKAESEEGEDIVRASFTLNDPKNVGRIVRNLGEMAQEELDPKNAQGAPAGFRPGTI